MVFIVKNLATFAVDLTRKKKAGPAESPARHVGSCQMVTFMASRFSTECAGRLRGHRCLAV